MEARDQTKNRSKVISKSLINEASTAWIGNAGGNRVYYYCAPRTNNIHGQLIGLNLAKSTKQTNLLSTSSFRGVNMKENIEFFDGNNNSFRTQEIIFSPNLRTLNLENNEMEGTLDLRHLKLLEEVNVNVNRLEGLMLPPSVGEVYCKNNALKYLYVPESVGLLDCSQNPLEKIVISKANRSIRTVYCNNTNLKKFELKNSMSSLVATNTAIKKFVVPENMVKLECNDSMTKKIILGRSLKKLICDNNVELIGDIPENCKIELMCGRGSQVEAPTPFLPF